MPLHGSPWFLGLGQLTLLSPLSTVLCQIIVISILGGAVCISQEAIIYKFLLTQPKTKAHLSSAERSSAELQLNDFGETLEENYMLDHSNKQIQLTYKLKKKKKTGLSPSRNMAEDYRTIIQWSFGPIYTHSLPFSQMKLGGLCLTKC